MGAGAGAAPAGSSRGLPHGSASRSSPCCLAVQLGACRRRGPDARRARCRCSSPRNGLNEHLSRPGSGRVVDGSGLARRGADRRRARGAARIADDHAGRARPGRDRRSREGAPGRPASPTSRTSWSTASRCRPGGSSSCSTTWATRGCRCSTAASPSGEPRSGRLPARRWRRPPGTFTPALRPQARATADDLQTRMKAGGVVLLDARSPREYAAGRIPGAKLLTWQDVFADPRQQVFKSRDALTELFRAAGAAPGSAGRDLLPDRPALERAVFRRPVRGPRRAQLRRVVERLDRARVSPSKRR